MGGITPGRFGQTPPTRESGADHMRDYFPKTYTVILGIGAATKVVLQTLHLGQQVGRVCQGRG